MSVTAAEGFVAAGVHAGIKANRYIRGNRDGTVQFLMEWLRLQREAAVATYESVVKVYNEDVGVCDKGLRLVVEETKKTVKSGREVPFGDVADLEIFRAAHRELGLK